MKLKQKQFLDTYIGLPLVYIHIILARFMGWLLKRDHSIHSPPKEICIIKLLGFGSIIMASDAIHSVKIKYPDAQLSIICSKSIEKGLRSIHLFEKFYVINDDNFLRLILSSLKIILEIKSRNLWIIDLEVYSKLTGILSLWTFARNRFGFYFNQVAFRYNLYTHNVYFNTVINVEDNYEQIVKAAIGFSEIHPFTIKGFPARLKQTSYDYIAVNNTCSELAQERKLTPNQLRDICHWIVSNTPYKVALLGAPSDKNINDQFINDIDIGEDKIVNIAGVYEFDNYYRFLYNQCVLMVTIDSAPLHIANKLNIPNLSIWGPTSPQSRVDTNTENEYIYLAVKCSPCTHFVDKLPCNGDNFCIKDITITQISLKIQHLLSRIKNNEQ